MSQQASTNGEEDAAIGFCTLGMFIIDEIEYADSRAPVKDIIGGAGSYSALGARIIAGLYGKSKSVGWIVDCGSDFPPELREIITQWDTSCVFRETPERLTTRGWNRYGANEHRAFKYLTPKLRLDGNALTPQLLRSTCFHLICSPTRCVDMVNGILDRRRQEHGPGMAEPLFVWEPVPDLCVPAELENCKQALKLVHYVSPNHEELAAFYGRSGSRGDWVDRALIEQCVRDLLQSTAGECKLKAVVVRAGKEGCCVAIKGGREFHWLPAYYEGSDQKVVDPTGGGNAFLGGFAIHLSSAGCRVDDHRLAEMSTLTAAAISGSVAASFAIEQVGMPTLIQGRHELWNGESPLSRVQSMCERMSSQGHHVESWLDKRSVR